MNNIDFDLFVQRLNQVGLRLKVGKKEPINGRYSGIVGNRRKLIIDTKNMYSPNLKIKL